MKPGAEKVRKMDFEKKPKTFEYQVIDATNDGVEYMAGFNHIQEWLMYVADLIRHGWSLDDERDTFYKDHKIAYVREPAEGFQ